MANLLSALSTTAIQISNVSGALSTVANLVTGGGPIVLGSFVFEGFEVPSSVSYGPRQTTKLHDLPGGNRWIDSMMSNESDISWSGIMLSPDAADRCATLQALANQGIAQPLTFGDYYYEVVITSVPFRFLQPGRIEYQITCQVQTRNQTSTQPSLLGAITSDISSALGISLPSGLAGVTSALSNAQSVVQTVTSLTGSGAAQSVLGALTSAQSIVGSVSSAANSALGALTAGGPLLAGADAAINQVNNLTTQTGILAGAGQVGAYVSRAANNLTGGLL